jgi:hypothetical protein
MYRLVVLDHVVGDFPEKDLAEDVVEELREYMDLVENVDYTIKEIHTGGIKDMYKLFIADVEVATFDSYNEAVANLVDYGIGGEELDSESADYQIRKVKN